MTAPANKPDAELSGKPSRWPEAIGLSRFEFAGEPVISRRKFAGRMMVAVGLWVALTLFGLAIGMAGYGYFGSMSLVDAYLNAAMILSGMGPVGEMNSTGGKIFAASYAIFSGLVIVVATGLVVAPIFHRVLHHFHVERHKQD